MRKFLKLAAIAATVTAPVVAVVSCSDGNKKSSAPEILLVGDATKETKMNAFGQGIFDGAKRGADKVNKSFGRTNVAANTPDGRRKTIMNAYDNGTRTFVLSSFSFGQELNSLAKEFPQAKFIAVDTKTANENTNVANVWAETQQNAFLSGYLIGKWVDTNMKKANRNVHFAYHDNAQPGDNAANKVKIGYSGGFAFETVTRFFDGLRAGVAYWNKHNNSANDYDVDFMYSNNVGAENFDRNAFANNWDNSSEEQKVTWQRMMDAHADITIGNENVAQYNTSHPNQKIWNVAVDADVAVASPTQLPYTITSIVKNVGSGVENIINHLYGATPDTSDFTKPFNPINGGLDAPGVLGVAKNNLGDDVYSAIYNADNSFKTTPEARSVITAAKNSWYRQNSNQTWTQYLNSLTV